MNITINEAKLTGLVLGKGGHYNPTEGLCLTEAVAYTHDQPHTDNPDYVSAVLNAMGRELNDGLPDDVRQRLIPLIRVLPGTADDGHDATRAYMALDWFIRVWLPTWLELSPACRVAAAKVRGLDPVMDFSSAQRAIPVVHAARDRSNVTRNTIAGSIARSVADAATWETASVVARDTVKDFSRSIAYIIAYAAAAWDATWTAATAAATTAIVAENGAGNITVPAARAVLQPTITTLQLSAIELYHRMAVVASLR